MDKSKWEYKKLGEVCAKGSSNIILNKIKDNEGDYPLYGATGFVKNIDFYHQDKEYIGIVKDGSGVGRVNIYPAKSSLVGTMQYIIPTEGISLSYLKYFLQSKNLGKYASGAAIPHIYFRDYSKELIPILPYNLQQQIVAELDQLNELISLKQQQLKEFDALAQSIFYEMFGDPLSNKKGFERNKLGAITKVGSSRRVFSTEFRDKGIPFYRGTEIAAIAEGSFEGPTLFISKDRYDELVSQTGQPQLGDLLLPSICPNGRIMVVRDASRFYIKDGRVLWIRANRKKFVSEYLKFVLSIILLRDYNKYASGATFKELKIFTLSSVPIPLPPLTLQQSFAERVRAIERQKALVKQSIAEVQTLLDSRMQEYFG